MNNNFELFDAFWFKNIHDVKIEAVMSLFRFLSSSKRNTMQKKVKKALKNEYFNILIRQQHWQNWYARLTNDSTNFENLIKTRRNRTAFVFRKDFITASILFKITKSKKREFEIITVSILFLNFSLSTTIFDISIVVSISFIIFDDHFILKSTFSIKNYRHRSFTDRFSILRAFISWIKREMSAVREFLLRRQHHDHDHSHEHDRSYQNYSSISISFSSQRMTRSHRHNNRRHYDEFVSQFAFIFEHVYQK